MSATDYDIEDFYRSLLSGCNTLDVQIAIEKYQEVGLSPYDLAEDVRGIMWIAKSNLADIDVCHMAYDHILQSAGDKISSIVGFDICNDTTGGVGFHTTGIHGDASFDYFKEDQEKLRHVLENTSKEHIRELSEDNFVRVFLEDVEIDIKEILQNKESEMEVES
jgi:hypothetical protein